MAASFIDEISIYLPKYLTPAQKQELTSELRSFPDVKGFYWAVPSEHELLQGDGWRGFVAINYFTLERKTVSGVILSNSCDIDLKNERGYSPRVLFSPLIPLQRYADELSNSGKSAETVASTLAAIRDQLVTSLFYLPGSPQGRSESIAVLDDVHTMPVDAFLSGSRSLLFRLNQIAFYILLIKLSIHFCRAQEGIQRYPLDVP